MASTWEQSHSELSSQLLPSVVELIHEARTLYSDKLLRSYSTLEELNSKISALKAGKARLSPNGHRESEAVEDHLKLLELPPAPSLAEAHEMGFEEVQNRYKDTLLLYAKNNETITKLIKEKQRVTLYFTWKGLASVFQLLWLNCYLPAPQEVSSLQCQVVGLRNRLKVYSRLISSGTALPEVQGYLEQARCSGGSHCVSPTRSMANCQS